MRVLTVREAEIVVLILRQDVDLIIRMFPVALTISSFSGISFFPGKQHYRKLNSVGSSILARFINKPADGGVTALHLAAVNGYSDCVQLLLDLHASVSAVTFHYGSAINLIGIGNFFCPRHVC